MESQSGGELIAFWYDHATMKKKAEYNLQATFSKRLLLDERFVVVPVVCGCTRRFILLLFLFFLSFSRVKVSLV